MKLGYKLFALGTVLLVLALTLFAANPAQATTGMITIYAKALTDHECNSTEWHFVITQVPFVFLAPSYIHVTWANGASQNVSRGAFTGKTAHYTTTAYLDSTVVSASAQIYFSWEGQFNLSHGPCPQPPTKTPTSTPTSTPIPPTEVPPTEVPPTEVPPTEVPPTEVPPTEVPPTERPPVTPTEPYHDGQETCDVHNMDRFNGQVWTAFFQDGGWEYLAEVVKKVTDGKIGFIFKSGEAILGTYDVFVGGQLIMKITISRNPNGTLNCGWAPPGVPPSVPATGGNELPPKTDYGPLAGLMALLGATFVLGGLTLVKPRKANSR